MKTVIITGATAGIGLETAGLLSRQGYRVLGIGRSEIRCREAEARLRQARTETGSPVDVTFFAADLMQQSQVIRVAGQMKENLGDGKLHALINNAGCVRSRYTTTDEGYEQQFALNHLAGFLLTHLLLPCLLDGHGRVIMTSSRSHKGVRMCWEDVMLRRGYRPLRAYKQSKLCNVLFAAGLRDRYPVDLRAYAVDPGLVNTDIGNKQTGGLVGLVWSLRKRGGVSPDVPAQTYAYLCSTDPAPGGLYYRQCREIPCSRQVTSEQAGRLFDLSQQLCGMTFGEEY